MSIMMKQPVCLIENCADGTLRVNAEAADILSSIDEPVVVVGIVGLYRTGKSYLMNKLAKANRGFELGDTVQSKTKGIWMWCVPHPTQNGHTLVLLDTEGLGDVEKGDKRNDMNIFCLSVLLSSALVYNSKGTIDEDAIEKLRFVSELADFIKVKSKDNDNEEDKFSRHFPIFVWAVRDFVLMLEFDGKKISEDEYLENALAPRSTENAGKNSTSLAERNECREQIRMYFKSRKCFVFEPPSGNTKVLQNMDHVSEEELNLSFLAQTEKFCTYVYQKAEVKYLDQIHTVTGKILRNLVTLYTQAIMSSKVACMENVVMSISEMENAAAIREAVEHYEKTMEERGRFPTETDDEFSELSKQCEEEALQIFMKKSFKDSTLSFHKQYMEKMETKKDEFSGKNKTKSSEYCKKLIANYSKDIDESVSGGGYSVPGGHQKFEDDMKKLVERYNKEPGKGLQAESVLQDFLKSKETLKISIMLADKSLTEQQKKDEENKSRRKIEELERKLQEAKLAQESKKAEDGKWTTEMHLKAQLEKGLSENQRLQQKLDSVIQAKQREEELYTRQGCHEDAEMYRRQLVDLKQEKEELNKTSWVDTTVDTLCNVACFFGVKGIIASSVVRIAHTFIRSLIKKVKK